MDDDLGVASHWAVSVVGAIAAVVLLLLVPRRRAAAWSERSLATAPAACSFVGGGTWFTMWWPISGTWPLVRLDQFGWGVRVGPNYRWMAWFLPTTDMRWAEILLARRTRMTIRFTTRASPKHWVSFGYLGYSPDPRLVLAIQQNGVRYSD